MDLTRAYATEQNLPAKTNDWLERIARVNQHQPNLVPDRSALLVVDMQNYFLSPASPKFIAVGKVILPNVIRLIESFRANSRPVIFTRHAHQDETSDGGVMLDWWGEIIREGTDAAQLLAGLTPQADEIILDKCRYSAFYETDLDLILKEQEIDQLVICGVKTNLCCESTARDGYYRNYRLVIPADATAASSEEMHLASLLNLAYGFAAVTETAMIVEQFKQTPSQ